MIAGLDRPDDGEIRINKQIRTAYLEQDPLLGATGPVMDAILHNNKGKSADDITVYKVGPHDGSTCDHCYRFWFLDDRLTPRVYKMSELMANGTNIGKKQKDWKPTVDATHPNERHLLQELRPGFGFKSGKLEWIGQNHDEYKKQRGV